MPKTPRLLPTQTLLYPSCLTALFALLLALAGPAAQPRTAVALPRAAAVQEQSESSALTGPDTALLQQRKQHLDRFGISLWHAAGHRGKGVKVAVLDSGFRGYRELLGTALPARVTARSFRFDGNLEAKDSQHGMLCGEVVHALAPEAALLFANWEPGHPEQFLAAVRWARQQGAQVISCSCIMPNWSDGEGGGAVHAELSRLLGDGRSPGDLLCFASAGNTAQRHWCGSFRAGTDGCHQWQTGNTENALSPWGGGEHASIQLYCAPGSAYEVCVLDRASGRVVARAVTALDTDRCSADAGFQPEPRHSYSVRVKLLRGEPGRFHLVALHSGLEVATMSGSICFPADGKDVIAVGAVSADGRRCGYSACGPNSRIPKPDLVAPVPFASLWRPKAFAGTSAAAPQAAALAALYWSRHTDWGASRVRQAMQSAAEDLGPRGHDCETGYGLVHLPSSDVLPASGQRAFAEPAAQTLRPAALVR